MRARSTSYSFSVSVTRQLSFEFSQKFKKVIIAIAISLARYSLMWTILNKMFTISTFKITPIKQTKLNFKNLRSRLRFPVCLLETSPKVHRSFHKKLLMIAISEDKIALRVKPTSRFFDSPMIGTMLRTWNPKVQEEACRGQSRHPRNSSIWQPNL